MRLIDGDAILKADENSDKALVLGNGKSLEIAYALLKKKVADAPTVDAVPVVRCEDCAVSQSDGWVCSGTALMPQHRTFPNSFCSDGERKDGGNADENRDPEN